MNKKDKKKKITRTNRKTTYMETKRAKSCIEPVSTASQNIIKIQRRLPN
jgi:hypothetical protein